MPLDPCAPPHCGHREVLTEDPRVLPCCVARKVSKSEWMSEPAAKGSMEAEWNKLVNHKRPNPKDKGKGAWEMSSVRELFDVKAEARRRGQKIHHGRISELCNMKHSDLPKYDPRRNYKGRDVFFFGG